MKLTSLCVFIVFLCLFNFAQQNDLSLETLMKASMSGQFWFQKVYRGDDPLLVVKHSQQAMQLKFFTLNDRILAYSESREKSKNIEGIFI